MRGKTFVDTNVLVYAHDLDAGAKHEIGAAVVRDLWEREAGTISTQVLQEFYVTMTRKIPSPLSRPTARGIIENYAAWHVRVNDLSDILLASELEDRYRLSFWDAMIVAAALHAGMERILTEDLSHGQRIEGILVENPFQDKHIGVKS